VTYFYLDENIPIQVVPELLRWGHQAVTVRNLRLLRGGDDEHLLLAAQRGWILVTCNRDDFILLQNAWQRWTRAWQVQEQHAGILITPHEWLSPQVAFELHHFMQAGPQIVNRLYDWRQGTWTIL
jgi:predicted nuclease of predicted toxin-antitoxin system